MSLTPVETPPALRLDSPRDLLRQVELTAWELDPRAGAALGQIGAEATVVLTDTARTAQISRIARGYRIEVSPSFVKEHACSPRDLLFVLLHEIRHKVQGDLLRPGGNDRVSQLVANIVADVRINGDLCREFFPEGVPLLDRLYADLSIPSLLLLPPHRLLARFGPARGVPDARSCATIHRVPSRGSATWEVVRQTFLDAGVDPSLVVAFVDWYHRAWLTPGSHDVLYKQLRKLVTEESAVTFLGNHDSGAGRGRGRRRTGRGAGRGDVVLEDALKPEEPPDRLELLRRQIRAALEPDSRVPREEDSRLPDRGVYPTAGRREAFLLAQGAWPVFFPSPLVGHAEQTGSVRVYVDVSGSTGPAQPLVYGIVRSIADIVREPVYLFSNVVEPISSAEVRLGVVRTTGGTDFDCVVEHALRERARKILIVTDGEGPLRPRNAAALLAAELQIYLLLTNVRNGPSPIHELANETWLLPDLEESDDLPF